MTLALGPTQHLPPGAPALKPHPFANLFPMMSDTEFAGHLADIRANGINHPIILHRGAILDGRNRYRAALECGIGIAAQVFSGTDREALDLVASENIHRRHLTTEQRALIAAQMAEIRLGGNQHTSPSARSRASSAQEPAQICAPGLPLTQAPPPRFSSEGGIGKERAARTSWPAGHVIRMTREYPGDGSEPVSVGTCECGAQYRFPVSDHDAGMDAACEAHWCAFDPPSTVVPAEAGTQAAMPSGPEDEAAPALIEPPRPLISQAEAAAAMNVSRRTVQHAAVVVEKGAPELVEAVAQGKLATSTAADIAQLPIEEQRRIIASADPKAVKDVAKGQRAEKAQASRERKLEKLRAINEAAPLITGKRYVVIYADPPWRFEVFSRETGMEKSADNHYPTMDVDAIKALSVPEIAAPDCVLFLWATAPMLPQALEVMGAWGFIYKSHIVWDKQRSGTGFWFRNRHELLLLGTRGDIPAPLPAQYPSLIAEPSGAHSVKPLTFINMIEHMFPGLPSIELFSRLPRQGWDAWGNQAAGASAPSAVRDAGAEIQGEAAE
jgi:N6-adenosine-specific RNA methylase IME4